MTGYALKCLINGKVHLDTFSEFESFVKAHRSIEKHPEDWQVVRVRWTEIKPRIKPRRKASILGPK